MTKQLDGNLPSELEEFLNNNQGVEMVVKLVELENVEPLKDSENKVGKRKRQSDQVGVQSMEMLKVRAALEERLKQEGILSSRASKSDKAQKRLKLVNGRLVTYDDFGDDAIDVGATRFNNGHASSLSTSKLSQIVSAKTNKPKFPNALGAFMYPIYGHGELPQAFFHRAAVKGCIHFLMQGKVGGYASVFEKY